MRNHKRKDKRKKYKDLCRQEKRVDPHFSPFSPGRVWRYDACIGVMSGGLQCGRGVVSCISPWSYPLCRMHHWQIDSAPWTNQDWYKFSPLSNRPDFLRLFMLDKLYWDEYIETRRVL